MGHVTIASDNYVAFTFFIGTMAMMAASVFFFFELNNTSPKWRTSVLVSGLITFIAAVHYYYMRGYNLETGDSPTFFRYVDWILTVPLMCVEFYLITKKYNSGFIKKYLILSFVINCLNSFFYLTILLLIGTENINKNPLIDILSSFFLALKLVTLFITDYRTVKIIDIIDTKNKNTK